MHSVSQTSLTLRLEPSLSCVALETLSTVMLSSLSKEMVTITSLSAISRKPLRSTWTKMAMSRVQNRGICLEYALTRIKTMKSFRWRSKPTLVIMNTVRSSRRRTRMKKTPESFRQSKVTYPITITSSLRTSSLVTQRKSKVLMGLYPACTLACPKPSTTS